MKSKNRWQHVLQSRIDIVILVVLLAIFLGFSIFMALNLKQGIIPDESAHLIFSEQFASTLGIPEDSIETASLGWYIEQNPFLYWWINGRIINALDFFAPEAAELQIIRTLRLVNVVYGLGTVLFIYLLSRELIQHKLWQLLPVFLITHTLMFLFLSSGINYDNLAIFLCTAGIYFWVRVLTKHKFVVNTLSWMVFIAAASLVKFTVLPLALGMAAFWVIYLIKEHNTLSLTDYKKMSYLFIAALLFVLLIINFSIYGMNLIRFQSIRPPCREILSESECALSPWALRARKMIEEPRMTIRESVQRGYPDPISYGLIDWVYNMLLRTFGMIGQETYFPLHLIQVYLFLFYLAIILGVVDVLFWQKLSFVNVSLLMITFFYGVVLFLTNYNAELVYGFRHISLQGRYIFPVIAPIYLIIAKVLKFTPIRFLKWLALGLIFAVFVIGGPLSIIFGYHSFLSGWFIG